MSTLVHITPQLPPAIDGVGDYCWHLWKHWPEPERDWHFLVARGAQATIADRPELNAREFALNALSLSRALEEARCDTVVLHYVSYAYQPKGAPTWLPRALAEWKRQPGSRRRLITMFHEMYARSSPLRSPFWVAPFAKRIIRDLVQLSDAWMTSCDRYFNQLVTEFSAEPNRGRIAPIASNIQLSEPVQIEQSPAARQRILVFGLAKTRLWALERHWRFLRELNHAGLIEHITFAGKAPEPEDERAWQRWANCIGADTRWRKRFNLAPSEISQELAEHDLGLLTNEPDILTKSGVFAALATHGVIPVISVTGDAPLPERVRGAALVNDDRSTIQRLVQIVRERENWTARRERLLDFAECELAWPAIARSWADVLNRATGLDPAHASLETMPPSQLRRLPAGTALRTKPLEVSA